MRRLLITTSAAVVLLLSALWGCHTNSDRSRTPPGYVSLFKDTCFQHGFSVGSVHDGVTQIQGYLDYDGTVPENPQWHIAQWYCFNNDLLTARYTQKDFKQCYETTGGSKVIADTETGSVWLELDSSSEFGFNGMDNPRKKGQNWPNILMSYRFADQDKLKLSDKTEIHMDIDYTVTLCETKMPAEAIDTSLHAAHFQWFLTIQNLNKESVDFGRYFWFGLSYFDNRFEFAPYYAALDGGKEIHTGSFIYMPSMKEILGEQGPTEVGKPMHVFTDVLPMLRSGLEVAQQRGYLTDSCWDDFYLADMNIGWEVPGTYHVGVRIDYLNINYK